MRIFIAISTVFAFSFFAIFIAGIKEMNDMWAKIINNDNER